MGDLKTTTGDRLQVARSVVVDLSPVLARQLATLGSSGAKISDAVESLHGMLLVVVPSAIGIAVTVHLAELDVTMTTLPEGVEPQTSLRLPLSIWADFEAGSEVIFYASTPGALVDLAAELGWALKLNIAFTRHFADRMLVVDQHLNPATGLSGLDELSTVNQAVGALMSRGRSPDAALEELNCTAILANSSIDAAARALMGRLGRSVTRPRVDLSALTARAQWDGTAGSGDHLCGLYRGENQRDEIMLPYLRVGLTRGDQCLCLIDRTDPSVVMDRLSAGPDAVDASPLDIRSTSDVYLANGDFVADEMYEFLDETAIAVSAARDGTLFRATGEMSWATGDSRNVAELFTYESNLNRMTSAHAPALLCLFDLDDLDDRALENVLRTHPTIVYDHGVIDNPHYLPA